MFPLTSTRFIVAGLQDISGKVKAKIAAKERERERESLMPLYNHRILNLAIFVSSKY